jgi:hypothetical protein
MVEKLTEESQRVKNKISAEELNEIKASIEKAQAKSEISVIYKILANLEKI